jgi:hypothetical protein
MLSINEININSYTILIDLSIISINLQGKWMISFYLSHYVVFKERHVFTYYVTSMT